MPFVSTFGGSSIRHLGGLVTSFLGISLNYQGGSGGETSVVKRFGTFATMPTPTQSGYNFSGWYDSASGGNKVADAGATYLVIQPKTLYAQWAVANYTVTYNNNGGTGGSASSSVGIGSFTILPTPTYSDKTLNGWYDAVSGGTKIGNAGDSYFPSSSVTLYAQWWTPVTVGAYYTVVAGGMSRGTVGVGGRAGELVTNRGINPPYGSVREGVTYPGGTRSLQPGAPGATYADLVSPDGNGHYRVNGIYTLAFKPGNTYLFIVPGANGDAWIKIIAGPDYAGGFPRDQLVHADGQSGNGSGQNDGAYNGAAGGGSGCISPGADGNYYGVQNCVGKSCSTDYYYNGGNGGGGWTDAHPGSGLNLAGGGGGAAQGVGYITAGSGSYGGGNGEAISNGSILNATTNGAANTGGGSGGANQHGANGGSGIIIISFPISLYPSWGSNPPTNAAIKTAVDGDYWSETYQQNMVTYTITATSTWTV